MRGEIQKYNKLKRQKQKEAYNLYEQEKIRLNLLDKMKTKERRLEMSKRAKYNDQLKHKKKLKQKEEARNYRLKLLKNKADKQARQIKNKMNKRLKKQ